MPEAPIITAQASGPQVPGKLTAQRRGLALMVLASAMFSCMNALIFYGQSLAPQSSPLVASGLRIAVNLGLLLAPALWRGEVLALFGDGRASLWARGGFGSLSLICNFAAVIYIGVGEAAFLHASNAFFVALLAPFFLGQKNSGAIWLAIFGAMFGLALLGVPRQADAMPLGRLLAVSSGLFAAFAYMMIARAGRSNPPKTVIFYLCLVALAAHLLLYAVLRFEFPSEPAVYGYYLAAGVLASVAQELLTRSYQLAPAALASAVSYVQPVLSLALGILVFAKVPDATAWLGAALVLLFGVALPFAQKTNP